MATAAFFAPLMVTVPLKGVPPLISYIAKDGSLLVKSILVLAYRLYHTAEIM
jgi:hypothetical protein